MSHDPSSPKATPRARHAGTYRVPIEAVNAMKDGRVIEAIKIVRQSGNFGLAEAKGIIDELQRAMPQGTVRRTRGGQRLSPGEVSRGAGGGGWLVLVVVMIAVVAAAYYWT